MSTSSIRLSVCLLSYVLAIFFLLFYSNSHTSTHPHMANRADCHQMAVIGLNPVTKHAYKVLVDRGWAERVKVLISEPEHQGRYFRTFNPIIQQAAVQGRKHEQKLPFTTLPSGNIYFYLVNLNLWFCFRCSFQMNTPPPPCLSKKKNS